MTPEEQQAQNEEILKLAKEMQETLTDVSKTSSEVREAQEAMKLDLAEKFGKQKDFQTMTEMKLKTLTDEVEDENKQVWDLVLHKGTKIPKQLGYLNPVERALYKPETRWTKRKGWEHTGHAYEVSKDLMDMNDMLFIMGWHKSITSKENISFENAVKSFDLHKIFLLELQNNSDLRKALNTATTGEGADWVPQGFSANLIDDIRLQLKVAALFNTITLPAKSGAFEVPLRGSRKRAYLIGEATTDEPTKVPAVTIATGSLVFTAKRHGLRMLFTDDMDEDSAIAIMPIVREELVQAISDAQEDMIISGDTTATHQDSDVTSADDVRKSANGLRKLSGGSSGAAAINISTLNTANLRAIRKAMGRFGVNSADLAWVVSISGYIQMLSITEVITMDQIGSRATILSGQMAAFDGSPVIVSEFMRDDLNTSGVHDGTETDTQILLVHRRSFVTGVKPSGIQIDTDRDIETLMNVAVISRRIDFQRVITPTSVEQNVGNGYGLVK